jgi:hypothetical protein
MEAKTNQPGASVAGAFADPDRSGEIGVDVHVTLDASTSDAEHVGKLVHIDEDGTFRGRVSADHGV